jgi:predicted ArsR family transcriptional regulator
MPSNLLGPLITSKTRLKLLLRFFLNQNLSGYLQVLSKELDENTNCVRVELNRLEEAGLLSAEEQGRRKIYNVNTARPLITDLSNMLSEMTGIDQLVDDVVSRIGDTLQQVWVTGALAMGINSEEIQVTLVGEPRDMNYQGELMSIVEILIKKKPLPGGYGAVMLR